MGRRSDYSSRQNPLLDPERQGGRGFADLVGELKARAGQTDPRESVEHLRAWANDVLEQAKKANVRPPA